MIASYITLETDELYTLQDAWNERLKSHEDSKKLRELGSELWVESRKLWAEASKIELARNKMEAERSKLCIEGRIISAEADKLFAASQKLSAEADLAFINAVIEACGKDVVIKKLKAGISINDEVFTSKMGQNL